ncbi:HNH endonuclease signature motif containing protein [Demequina gelatinilytica]|uniref:HNH endonuclease signature motif containing protein n=1 Tax=Demequina gelatinilytica TaxID=1638980 RepID=UPI000781FD93|nr:HNH endonuclease signature motif containing protein [Demequina gelatinilytica]
MTLGGPQAWLLLAADDNRGHAGNDGYDDQVDAYYSWDSNVPNHKKLAVGDPIALWDKERLLGVSVIEEITTTRGPKMLSRCPRCRATRISERKTRAPRYRCMKSECRHEFDEPHIDVVEVDRFRARYDAGWTPLDGLLVGAEIRDLTVHAGDFNAMRPIDWNAMESALTEKRAERALARVRGRMPQVTRPTSGITVAMPQGFRHALVRVRKGQTQFRTQILAQQGRVCAFTGGAPERVLEAGHLYSYAQLGEHRPHGGLMLRRDIHRLFDDGLLAVDPTRFRVDVAPDLAAYPQYERLHGEPLTVGLRDEQVDWLAKYWDEHRSPLHAQRSLVARQ